MSTPVIKSTPELQKKRDDVMSMYKDVPNTQNMNERVKCLTAYFNERSIEKKDSQIRKSKLKEEIELKACNFQPT